MSISAGRESASGIRCKYDVPPAVDIVELGSPQIIGICLARVRIEDKFGLCIVPVPIQHESC
jgi:hypothetical protein